MKNKTKKKNIAVSDAIKSKIPYIRCYEEEGMIEICPNVYTKTYQIHPLDPQNIGEEYSLSDINRKIKNLFNGFSNDINLQFLIQNREMDKNNYIKQHILEPDRIEDSVNEAIEDYNKLLVNNMDIGHNNVRKENFLTISISAPTPERAVGIFRQKDREIKDLFLNCYKIELTGLTTIARLESLYGILKTGFDEFGMKADWNGDGVFSFQKMKKVRLDTKDIIAPSSIDEKKDHILLNNKTYIRTFFVNSLPGTVSSNFISDITNINSKSLFSIEYEPLDVDAGFKVLSERVQKNTSVKTIHKRDTFLERRSGAKYQRETMIRYSEDAYTDRAELDLIKECKAAGDKMYAVSMVIALLADDMETLERDTKLLNIAINKFACQIRCLDLQQIKGLQTCLPLCNCKVDVKRVFGTEQLSSIHPISIQEVLKKDGLFYGLNAINDNLVFLNRKLFGNVSGIIAGVEHSGKTYQMKREALNALMSTDDRVVIIAMDDSYDRFIDKFEGHIYDSCPTNLFEIEGGYSLLGTDKYSKSIMLEALLRAIAQEKINASTEWITPPADLADRISSEVQELFSLQENGLCDFNNSDMLDFIKDKADSFPLFTEYMETLQKLTGTVDDENERLELYKVHSLPELIAAMDYLWNRAIRDKKDDISDWLFIDGIDKLLSTDQTLDYLVEYIRKMNDSKTVMTMVIEEAVKLFIDNASMVRTEELMDNVSYYKLLNLNVVERRKFVEKLSIPNSLVNYISNVEPGKGLIITPSANTAFDDSFSNGRDAFYQWIL